MNYFQADMNISFFVTGIRRVGKTEIIKKICGEEKDGKYSAKFSNFEMTFNELSSMDSAEVFYQDYTKEFQENTIILIVYSRTVNNSYKFARELYDIIKKSYDNIYFIETYQDKDDCLKRNEEFDQSIEDKIFKCVPTENSKDDLLSCFLYVSLTYQNTISPAINVCFPKHEIRNLVATSETMNRTFILTYKSIKMYSFGSNSDSELFINYQFNTDFTFYHPISLISNYDGTKLILITAFKFYLIDKFNSQFDPSAYFLPDVHRITPVEIYHKKMSNEQVIDVQFLPMLPDYFAVVFPTKIQIFKATNDANVTEFVKETCRSFEGEEFKMFRFSPIFKDMTQSDLFKLYYLKSDGKIYSLTLQNIKESDNSPIDIDTIVPFHDQNNQLYVKFNSKNQEKRMKIDFEYSRKPENFEIGFNQGIDFSQHHNITNDISYGFEFIKNEIIVYGRFSNQINFFHSNFRGMEVELKPIRYDKFSNDNVDIDGMFKIKDNLFVKTKDALFVFAFDKEELFVHKAIESQDIVGFTNTPFSCIISPGYIVSLSYYFTRVNPMLTYNQKTCQLLSDEYDKFEKSKEEFFDEYKNKSEELKKQSDEFKKKADEIKGMQIKYKERAEKVGEDLDKLEEKIKKILNQIYDINPIQHKTKILVNIKNPNKLCVIIGRSDYDNAFEDLNEYLYAQNIGFGFAFCESCQPLSIKKEGRNKEFEEFASYNVQIIDCKNTFIIAYDEFLDIDALKKKFVDIIAVTSSSLIQVSIFISQHGVKSINEVIELGDDDENQFKIYVDDQI